MWRSERRGTGSVSSKKRPWSPRPDSVGASTAFRLNADLESSQPLGIDKIAETHQVSVISARGQAQGSEAVSNRQDAEIAQELSLGDQAAMLKPSLLPDLYQGSEVHVGGDVLEADTPERVAI